MAGRVKTLTQAPAGTPLVRTDRYVEPTWLIFLNRLNAGGAASINILPGPPPATPLPANGTGIFYFDGLTPESLIIRVTHAGVNYDIPLFTFP